MQKLSKKLKICLYSSVSVAILAAIFMSISVLTFYDASENYLERSFLPILSIILIVVGVLAAFVTVFVMIPKGELNGDTPLTLPVTIASIFAALTLFVSATVIYGVAFDFGELSYKFAGMASNSQMLLILSGIFSLIAAIYFILNCFMTYADKKGPLVLVGFAVPVAAALYVSLSYFDISVSMNADIKILFHYSTISFMIWMLYEIRALISKPMPRMYFALGLATVVFSAVSSVPWLVGFIAGRLTGPINPSYIIYSIVSLGICVYASVRLFVFVSARTLLERIADQTPVDEVAFPDLDDSEESEEE